jgi:Zn-dependent protease
MNGNLRVGNLFGIPFYINPSWFLILGLVTWQIGFQFNPGQLGILAWVFGLVTALLLFASVLAHELGHSFAAIQQGIEVKSITLFIFGGIASLGEESKTPGDAFKVAIAGPLVSFVLFGVLTAIGIFGGVTGPLAGILGLLAYINLMLGAFNLIPGLPLDGGNVLKAIVWKITGKPYRGIAFASRVGQFFGWAAILLGVASLLGLSQIGSLWTLLIGWFLLQNAGVSAQTATIQEKLSGLKASDAIIPNSPIISANSSLRELVNNYVIGSDVKWRKFLVTDDNGQLLGEVYVDDLKTIPTNDWWNVEVRSLIKPAENLETVVATDNLLDAVNLLEQKQVNSLVVVDEQKSVLGLIEKQSIIELLQNQQAESEPANLKTQPSG